MDHTHRRNNPNNNSKEVTQRRTYKAVDLLHRVVTNNSHSSTHHTRRLPERMNNSNNRINSRINSKVNLSSSSSSNRVATRAVDLFTRTVSKVMRAVRANQGVYSRPTRPVNNRRIKRCLLLAGRHKIPTEGLAVVVQRAEVRTPRGLPTRTPPLALHQAHNNNSSSHLTVLHQVRNSNNNPTSSRITTIARPINSRAAATIPAIKVCPHLLPSHPGGTRTLSRTRSNRSSTLGIPRRLPVHLIGLRCMAAGQIIANNSSNNSTAGNTRPSAVVPLHLQVNPKSYRVNSNRSSSNSLSSNHPINLHRSKPNKYSGTNSNSRRTNSKWCGRRSKVNGPHRYQLAAAIATALLPVHLRNRNSSQQCLINNNQHYSQRQRPLRFSLNNNNNSGHPVPTNNRCDRHP